jgi:patatin-like phospholipase/acyl hydrolase
LPSWSAAPEDRLQIHFIAGTSTGGIIALGLAKPRAKNGKPAYSARELVELYESQGKVIFARSCIRRIRGIGSLLEDKYDARGIEKVLHEYFGSARLKDVTTEVLITAYEIERRCPFFFKSARARLDSDHDFPLAAVARATSAAPTYFEPFKLVSRDRKDYYALVDGGVFANNPAICAWVEARTMFPDCDDFLMVSIGTGEVNNPIPYSRARNWGIAQWAKPLLDVVFDGVSNTVDYQLRELMPTPADGSRRYYRFQVSLDEKDDQMDDPSPEKIRALKLLAENLLDAECDKIDILCRQLLV